ncbi:acetylornithine deacetylase [Mesorhizobium sp. AaZ16]|uniref:acetylornithine deacetylase n=1 Tax=Mesorhizobium sp. AaZ16 TaxID=3402289 RepID=UPI00374F6739
MNKILDGAISVLDGLVSCNTVSSKSNLNIVDYISSYLRLHNVEPVLIHDETGLKANVFATIGDPSKPGYVLSGHTDVVPIEGQDWKKKPFALTRDGDRLYGRGTTDMKGFVACVLAMVPQLSSLSLERPIHLAFSYDEEVGCHGVHGLIEHLKNNAATPVAAFIGEPSGMDVVEAHKGSYGMITNVTGLACHSSRPDIGVSAINAAVQIVNLLQASAEEFAEKPSTTLAFGLPYTTVGVGVMRGGTARNLVPGDCRIEWDIRSIQPEERELVKRRLSTLIEDTLLPEMRAVFEGSRIESEVVYDVPPLVQEPDSEAVRLAKRFAGANSASVIDYGTEAGFFQRAGIPSVVCGPGSFSEAHIEDEWISVGQIQKCLDFLEALVRHAERS